MPKIKLVNYWRYMDRYSGHAHLLGFEYSLWSDYGYTRQTCIQINILGIGVVLLFPAPESEMYASWKERKERDIDGHA